MNPVEYLELKGWVNAGRFAVQQTGPTNWRLTFKGREYLGQDTINYLTAYLKPRFDVQRSRLVNPPLPRFILCDITRNRSNDPMNHYVHLYLTENIGGSFGFYCVENAHETIVKYDLEDIPARELAKEIDGRVYYQDIAEYPSTNIKHYWRWNMLDNIQTLE